MKFFFNIIGWISKIFIFRKVKDKALQLMNRGGNFLYFSNLLHSSFVKVKQVVTGKINTRIIFNIRIIFTVV